MFKRLGIILVLILLSAQPAFDFDGRGGGGGGSSFTPDDMPAAYRTTTQTIVAGRRSTSANAFIPPLGSEFSISIWFRAVAGNGGVVWNLYDPRTAQGSQGFGGSSLQAMALDFSGSTPVTAGDKNLLTLTGTDKDGNHLSARMVVASGANVSAYGYRTTETLVNSGGYTMLLTVQYRGGNIELWATYRGMAPRLMIRQATTWNGTSSPLPFWVGGGNYNGTGSGVMELEQPTIIPDRSLSTNEIAQLADGISPEALGSGGHATAAIKFSSITSGGSSAADAAVPTTPTDGKTITLNGSVYTFKSSPSAGKEVQIVADVSSVSPKISTIDGTITINGHGLPNGRRVSVRGSTQPSGWEVDYAYYVVNAARNTFQIALTPGGTPVVPTDAGSGTLTIGGVAGTLDNLVALLNNLTPGTGGASNATYVAAGADTLFITARAANDTAFTFDTTATARMPAARRLALGWAIVTDCTAFNVGLLGSPGAVRRRSVAWTAPPGTELAPNTPVMGSVRLRSWTNGTVSQHVGGVGYLALSGIYTGNPPVNGAQFKFLDKADNSQVQDFTALTNFTYDAAARTWSGKITVPKGKRWLLNESKKTGNTQVTQRSEVKHGIGEIIIVMGRSIATKMFNLQSSSGPTPNGFVSRFSGTGTVLGATSGTLPVDNTWHVFTTATEIGSGEGALGNRVSNDSNAVVGYLTRAVGGSPFAPLVTPTVFNELIADAGNSFTDSSIAPWAGHYLWQHSQEFPYYPLLDRLYMLITQHFGTQIKLGSVSTSNFRSAPDGTTLIQNVRADQLRWVTNVSASLHSVAPATWDHNRIVDLGESSYFWSNTRDGVHPIDHTDLEMQGELWALSILNKMGITAHSGVGPTPVSATRSGANIDVRFDLNGATGLRTPSTGDVSGFDVALASNNFTALTSTVSIDISTDRVNWASNTVADDDPILISAAAKQPGGTTAGTTYFAINRTAHDFQLSATVGGPAIDFSSAGSGVIATDLRHLLTISSVSIISADTVRIVLASAPGAPVAVSLNWGRPGRQATDPTAKPSRAALTQPVATAQRNILVDNFPMSYSNAHVPGRPARATVTPLVTN